MCQVTVLMTVYNGMPYLQPAVESVLTQTLSDFRFVIVNDGSDDGTAAYLATLMDPRIVVINQVNQGTASAANHGLEIINTEFVARMDADDIALPQRLQHQLTFLLAHADVGIVGAQVAPAGEVSVGKSLRLPVDHDTIYGAMMEGQHGLAHSVIMIRTRVLKELGGYWSLPLIDDWDMMLRIGEVSKLANIDEVLLHYRVHAGSMNGQNMKRMHRHTGYAIERAKARTANVDPPSYEEYEQSLARRSFLTRAVEDLHIYAMSQYRLAIAELHGNRKWLGLVRLGWSACCSPSRTIHRLGRVFRASKLKPFVSQNSNGQVPTQSKAKIES